MKINNHENYVDNNNIEQQVASYQRENINQERAHCQKITEEINLVFFSNRGHPVEMWWHTVTHGRGSEGETGEWSG